MKVRDTFPATAVLKSVEREEEGRDGAVDRGRHMFAGKKTRQTRANQKGRPDEGSESRRRHGMGGGTGPAGLQDVQDTGSATADDDASWIRATAPTRRES